MKNEKRTSYVSLPSAITNVMRGLPNRERLLLEKLRRDWGRVVPEEAELIGMTRPLRLNKISRNEKWKFGKPADREGASTDRADDCGYRLIIAGPAEVTAQTGYLTDKIVRDCNRVLQGEPERISEVRFKAATT